MQQALTILNEVIKSFDWSARTDFSGIRCIGFLCDDQKVIKGDILSTKPGKILVDFSGDSVAEYHCGSDRVWMYLPNKRICPPSRNWECIHCKKPLKILSAENCHRIIEKNNWREKSDFSEVERVGYFVPLNHEIKWRFKCCRCCTTIKGHEMVFCCVLCENELYVLCRFCATKNSENKTERKQILNDEYEYKFNSFKDSDSDRLQRIIEGLRYYHSLNVIENGKDQDQFIDFMQLIYTEFLNDFIFLVNEQKLDELRELIEKKGNFESCTLSKCVFTLRHYENGKDENNENALDPILRFYQQSMDTLHFYVHHLYECGLRVIQNEEKEEKQDEEKGDKEYFDIAFSRGIKAINERKHITANFNRFKNDNKYNLNVPQQTDTKHTTFIDELFEYLKNNKVAGLHIERFKKFVEEQEFDQESIEYDVEYKYENIEAYQIRQYFHFKQNFCCWYIDNKHLLQTIKEFIEALRGIYFYILFLFNL